MKRGLLFGLAVILLVGCSSGKNVEYGNLQDSQAGEWSGSEQGKPEDGISWKNEFEVLKEDGSRVTVAIDAKTSIRGKLPMSVVEVKEVAFDAAFRKQILESFFGKSQLYHYAQPGDEKNLLYVTKSQLEEEIKSQEAWIQKLESGEYSGSDRPNLILELEALKTYVANLRAQQKEAPEDYVPILDYEGEKYLGYIGEEPYVADFSEWRDGYNPYSRAVRFCPLNNPLSGELKECKTVLNIVSMGTWTFAKKAAPEALKEVENEAEISAEQAREKAEELLQTLGFGDMIYQGMLAAGWTGFDEAGEKVNRNVIYNGYTFFYSVGEDGIGFEEYGIRSDYPMVVSMDEGMENIIGKRYETDLGAQITVTDEGVLDFCISNPVSVIKKTEDVTLLPLAEIEKRMVEEFKNHGDDILVEPTNKTAYYRSLDLIYFRVHSEENPGSYRYIPVWRLQKGEKELGNPLLINAMDGSFIDWREEF